MAPSLSIPHCTAIVSPSFSAAPLITSIYFLAGVKPDEMPENHSPFNLPNWCSLTSLSVITRISDEKKIAAQKTRVHFPCQVPTLKNCLLVINKWIAQRPALF